MMEQYDAETGELPPSNGAAATAIAAQARLAMQHQKMGIGNRSLNDAIENALKEIPIWIKADADVAITNSLKVKYATLKDILVAVRPILLTHRVRIRQGADRSYGCEEGGGVKGRIVPVYTDMIHTVTGEVERTIIEIPLVRLDARSMGSAITYGKRYSLLAALGLATDEADDDGARAMPKDMSAPVAQSNELAALRAEIDKIKDNEKLMAWPKEPKIAKRIDALSDDETVLLRSYYTEHARKLLGAE